MPSTYNIKEIYNMVRVFRDNGVFLIPKKPKKNNTTQSVVFWVRDRGQQFMQDAFVVNQNSNNFQNVLERYNQKKETALKKLFGKFENEKK